MRTGAIFARGSCRALKWMALVGVVFVLGSGQAAAQATPSTADFLPGTAEVRITMTGTVQGAPAADAFTVTETGTTGTREVERVAVDGRYVTLTLESEIESGVAADDGGRPTVDYDASEAGDTPLTSAAGDVADFSAPVPVMERNVGPTLTKPGDLSVNVDDGILTSLDPADGGNRQSAAVTSPVGITYELELTNTTTDGVTIDPSATDAANLALVGLKFDVDTLVLADIPGTLKVGVHTLRYTATDRTVTAGGVVEASADDANAVYKDFKLTVNAKGTTPTDDVEVKVKSVAAAASVAEGGRLKVTVTATVPKGAEEKGKIAARMVTVKFPADPEDDAKIDEGEQAEDVDFRLLDADGTDYYMWEDIPQTDKDSEQTYTFDVEIRRDVDAEDEKFRIEVQIGSTDAVKTKDVLMIDDTETQTYELSLPAAAKGAITEGAEDATKLTLKADPERTMDIEVALAVSPNDPTKYVLGSLSSNMFGMGDNATVTSSIRALADKNRTNDTITVTAYTTGSLGNNAALDTLDITVKDANSLPGVRATLVDKDGEALATQPMSVTEGETLMVMLTAIDEDGDSVEAAEELSVSLMPAGTAGLQDYRLSANPVEIASGKKSSAAVELMVLADNDVDEGEMLTLDAVVSGDEKVGPGTKSVMGVLSLMIEDGTMKLVWAKSMEDVQKSVYDAKEKGEGADKIFSPGEMIEVDASTLFNYAEGVTLNYVASSDAAAVKVGTSGSMVTVTATEAGMANVTITAHANAPAGVKILPQGEPDEASIMFPVEVGLEALSIMLSADEMNLVEGGMGATVTATANRAVTEDVTVMLMRDRAMSSAGEDDYMAEAITIMANEKMGTTMVTAVADDMMENEGNMAEELVLYGMTEGMAGEVTGELKFYIWDAAVPALPIIAQLLLAAFLAVGGYRRYRRR